MEGTNTAGLQSTHQKQDSPIATLLFFASGRQAYDKHIANLCSPLMGGQATGKTIKHAAKLHNLISKLLFSKLLHEDFYGQ